MSHDFSNRPDLEGLARVVGALDGVARPRGVPMLLIGAAARWINIAGSTGDASSENSMAQAKLFFYLIE